MKLTNPFKKRQQSNSNQDWSAFMSPKLFNSLTEDQKRNLATELDARKAETRVAEIGDGKAVFIEPMTDEEYVKWRHEEEHGWKGVYNKLLNRGEQ